MILSYYGSSPGLDDASGLLLHGCLKVADSFEERLDHRAKLSRDRLEVVVVQALKMLVDEALCCDVLVLGRCELKAVVDRHAKPHGLVVAQVDLHLDAHLRPRARTTFAARGCVLRRPLELGGGEAHRPHEAPPLGHGVPAVELHARLVCRTDEQRLQVDSAAPPVEAHRQRRELDLILGDRPRRRLVLRPVEASSPSRVAFSLARQQLPEALRLAEDHAAPRKHRRVERAHEGVALQLDRLWQLCINAEPNYG
eukprot:CAMPEP_0113270180 /NCGR_PEP_ID=MMETSP0008_2-20120614/22106_1 /TAXON_ID=97485 /ORGANISM="Prymnesium parvum" /LENGTH=253 /DNA_ID=CAMNT_0000119465 /DNA_START=98 /DNA_END=855 /DNA_ORIENTATION=- /assembly_acc=CAM_ASM_000153